MLIRRIPDKGQINSFSRFSEIGKEKSQCSAGNEECFDQTEPDYLRSIEYQADFDPISSGRSCDRIAKTVNIELTLYNKVIIEVGLINTGIFFQFRQQHIEFVHGHGDAFPEAHFDDLFELRKVIE